MLRRSAAWNKNGKQEVPYGQIFIIVQLLTMISQVHKILLNNLAPPLELLAIKKIQNAHWRQQLKKIMTRRGFCWRQIMAS
jgi:hypothetical protein